MSTISPSPPIGVLGTIYLVYLPPFFCSLVCEALVDHRHDFIQLLTVQIRQIWTCTLWDGKHALIVSSLSNLLHQRGRSAPRISICRLSDLQGQQVNTYVPWVQRRR